VSENIPESKSIKILSLNEINILIEELQDNYITNFNQILSKKISNSIIGIVSKIILNYLNIFRLQYLLLMVLLILSILSELYRRSSLKTISILLK